LGRPPHRTLLSPENSNLPILPKKVFTKVFGKKL
jgi:hypothetical protein